MASSHDPYPDAVYRTVSLNRVFAISSIATLLAIGGMIWQDYDREWKRIQREANAMEVARTEKEIAGALTEEETAALADLNKKIAEVTARVEREGAGLGDVENEIAKLRSERYAIDLAYKNAKSFLDVAKYRFEIAQVGEGDLAEATARLETIRAEFNARSEEIKSLDERIARLEGQVREITSAKKALETERTALSSQRDRLQRRLDNIMPGGIREFRNMPVLDFVAPSIQVRQIVVDDLYDNYNFATVKKVDRCITCHTFIDKPGYEEAPQPHTTHPRLDLYLGSTSPHNIEKFGCTSCHDGRGWATDFNKACHTPRDAEQKKEWEEKYDWHPDHYWEKPMLPAPYAEAGCYKCHSHQVEVKGAPTLNAGRKLFEQVGCFGCHKVKGLEDLKKVGPNLTHLRSKTDDAWVAKWLEDPRAFKAHTWMPKFWGLDNSSAPADLPLNAAEINAVTAFVMSRSTELALEPAPVEGDAARGKTLVATVGCVACHRVPGIEGEMSSFGPPLENIGSKLRKGWLYDWVRNPRHYHPDTRMPSLRLSEQEAADVEAFLLTLRDEEWERKERPRTDPKALDSLVVEFFARKQPLPEAAASVAKMSLEEKNLFLGEKIVARYGCFGCHVIPGYEKAQNIGTELTEEGAKDIARLDFGFIGPHKGEKVEPPTDAPIERTRHDWFRQKLANPRIFDRMKVKTRDEKLKMPLFGFTDQEITALVTFVSGLVKEPIPLQMTQRLDGDAGLVEAGARVIRDYNCKGCHQFDLDEMRLLADVIDKSGKSRRDAVWVHGMGSWVADEDTGEDAMSFTLWRAEPKLEKGPSDPLYVPKADVQIFEPAERGTVVPLLMKKYQDEKGMGSEARSYAPPVLVGEGKKVRSRWLFEFLRNPVTLRPWLEVRMPTFPFTDKEINDLTAYFAAREGEPFPFESIREREPNYLAAMEATHGKYFETAEALFNDKDVKCASCHVRGSVNPEGDPSGWAPDLTRAKERLSPRWIREWLANPQVLQPGTKMPKFPWGETYPDAFGGDAAAQIEAIKDYLMNMPEPDGTRALPD